MSAVLTTIALGYSDVPSVPHVLYRTAQWIHIWSQSRSNCFEGVFKHAEPYQLLRRSKIVPAVSFSEISIRSCHQGRRQGGALDHGFPLGAEKAPGDCSAPSNRDCSAPSNRECVYRENVVGGEAPSNDKKSVRKASPMTTVRRCPLTS